MTGAPPDPADDPHLAAVLAFVVAYTENGDVERLLSDESLAAADRLLATARHAAPDGEVPVEAARAVGLLRLCRFAAGADPADLAAATTIFRAIASVAPELVPPDLLDRLDGTDADRLATYGADLLRDARDDADPALLDHAVTALRAAVDTTGPDDPDLAGRLSNLSLALRIRADRTGDDGDLDEAVEVGEAAVAAATAGDPDRATYLSTAADAVHSRFERRGASTDIDRAVALHRRAVGAGAGHHAEALLVTGLGGALLNRFHITGDRRELDEAVAVCRHAVALAGPDGPELAGCQANLAGALATRAAYTGDPVDLDDAVIASRAAVDGTGDGHPLRAGRLSNLAGVLQTRHVRHRSGADLDAAIDAAAAAVTAAGPGDPYLGMYLSNLGFMLRVRGESLGRDDDLDAAVAVGRHAVAATPARHPALAGRLSNVGMSLLSRYERTGRDADLDDAVDALRRAVAQGPAGDPYRPMHRSNLAVALNRRSSARPDPPVEDPSDDLAEAVDEADRALAELPAGHPFRAGAGLNAGIVYEARFDRTGHEPDYERAVTVWGSAASEAESPLDNRAAAGRRHAEFAARRRRWADAAAAYVTTVALLAPLAWRGIDGSDRERLLAGHAGVAGDAVAACLADGRTDTAVATLEAGRNVLWAQRLELHGDLDRVRATAPGLAHALARVRGLLDEPLTGPGS